MGKDSRLALKLKAKTVESGGCWEWAGALFKVGYGIVPKKWGGGRYAHRAMFESIVCPIPQGMYVLHTCDNRKCINPEHLFLGTHLDNVRDMHAKNRQRGGSMPNEKNPSCKFADEQIKKIRSAYAQGVQKRLIEKQFQISETHYYRVIKGVSRKLGEIHG